MSRIGGPNTPPRSAGALTTSFNHEDISRNSSGQLRPIAVSGRRHSTAEQPRWSANPYSPSLPSLQSPLSDTSMERRHSTRFGGSGGENDSVDDHGVQDLNIQERSPKSEGHQPGATAGTKRRADSPPSESIDPTLRGQMNHDRWSDQHTSSSQPRPPQAVKLQDAPGSLSSTGSGGQSYGSSYGISNASSATSYSSELPPPPPPYHKQENMHDPARGPGSMQPPATPTDQTSPVTPNPQSNRAPAIPHRRAGSSGMPRPGGLWICDCCPKKPKKFESEDELR